MRSCFLVLAVCMAAAMAGCSSGSSETTVKQIGEGTTAEPSSSAVAEKSGEGGLDREAFEATVESLEARIEEMEILSESRQKAMEESLREMESSIRETSEPATGAGRTGTAGTGETADVSYRELLRSAAEYENRVLSYTGRVIQSVGLDSRTVQLLLAVDQDDSEQMVCEIDSALLSAVPGRGDIVTVRGAFDGVHRYLMGDGTRVELPSLRVNALTIDQVAESVPETVPESVPEAGPDAAPEGVPEAGPDAVPESVPEAVPDAVPESVPDAVPDAVPESVSETVPDTVPESISDIAPESISETVPDTASETVPETAPGTAP